MSNHATKIVIFFETTKLSERKKLPVLNREQGANYKKLKLILPLPLQQGSQLREPQQELRPQP